MAKINEHLKLRIEPDPRDKDSVEYGPITVDYEPRYFPVQPPVSEAVFIKQEKGYGRTGKDTIMMTVNQIDDLIKTLRDVQNHYRACVKEESRPKPKVGLKYRKYRQAYNDYAIYEIISIVSDGSKNVITIKYVGTQPLGSGVSLEPTLVTHYYAYDAAEFFNISSHDFL